MIKLKSVYKTYQIDKQVVFRALKNINIEILPGEFISIMGPSGSGKSTLMHIIGLLDKPSQGKVIINKQDVSLLNDDQLALLRNAFIGFVFQQFNLINKLTVLENILLPTIYSRKKLNFEPKKKALELIKRFGLQGKENSYPNKISGGQQQRVAILRALIMNPKIILADEPTGNLDSKSGSQIMKILKKLNQEDRITVVVVTHEKNIAHYAQRVIKIKDGKII